MKRIALFFEMTENERKGFLFSLILMSVVAIVPSIYRFFIRHNAVPAQLSWSENNIDRPTETDYPNAVAALKGTAAVERREFPFNPNNLPVERWRDLGFSDKQIRVIKNYEAKGGRFYSPKDVEKMYSISAAEFKRIAPYLRFDTIAILPAVGKKSFEKFERESKPAFLEVNINLADTSRYKALQGIGSVLASRIVKFRDNLGGFYSVDQIREVYGISDEVFLQIKTHLRFTGEPVQKLAINELSVEELAKHPYISRKIALLIVRYREQHGAFQTLDDLSTIYTLDSDFLRKIEPYLNFNRYE
ncbi:helix-hairpin-helix domain-containing protein [Sphingobacterium sp. LRF_L2]|uniref:helix-hairpin-helix domain-containing protein n=1 Tax=Sphingobacterium sp. LRF_L2 TaxID=3369421 RepID=UPI003F646178